MPTGLESSGSSSCGRGSPIGNPHDHPMPSLSASPPSTSSDSGSSFLSCRRPSLEQLSSPKGTEYKEKRKRNNDAARKSREKRRLNDVAMEAKLLELTKENDMLKNRLNSIETVDLKPLMDPVAASEAPGSVIMRGPLANNPSISMPSSFFAPHLSGFTPFGGLPPPPDFGYQNFDFNFAAAAAAAGFKLPQSSTIPSNLQNSTIFSNHLLAAAAAALPSFMHPSQPPLPNSPAFPNDPMPSGFLSSSHSAFQRPSVVEMTPPVPIPAPPRPSATDNLAASRPTSVIMGTSRPSVVQASGSDSTITGSNGCTLLDLSQSSTLIVSTAPHGQFQFVNSLPLACESQGSITVDMGPQTLPPLAQLDLPGASGSPFSNIGVIKQHTKQTHPTTTQNLSLLGTLLTANRPISPKVPQSRTEQQSGLATVKPVPSLIVPEVKAERDALGVQLPPSVASSSSNSLSCSPVDVHKDKSDTDSHGTSPSTRSGSEEAQLKEKIDIVIKKQTPDLERYRDRRRRNNEAAKRCRANRRAAFEYRSKRSQQLETENGALRQEMLKLSNELEHLKSIIAAANHRLLPTTS